MTGQQEVASQAALGDVQVGYQEDFLHRRSSQGLGQAVQRGGGFIIPESAQETAGCGT